MLYMKKHKLWSSIAATVLLLTACRKDFLAPPTNELGIVPETVFSDSARAGGFLANIYANMYNESMQLNGNGWGFSSMSDEVNDPIGFDPVNAWIDGSINPQSPSLEGGLGGIFTSQYNQIRRCNLMLKYENLMTFNPDLKKKYIGETQFLRAFFYFDLLRRYGGVPLVSVPEDPNVLLNDASFQEYKSSVKRSSFERTAAFILQDLEAAKAALSWYPETDNDRGRATAGAAVALKSRLLLYAASPLFNSLETAAKGDSILGYTNHQPSRWQLAADAAQEFINLNNQNSGWYQLYNSYPNLFLDGRQAANREIIWYRQTFPYSANFFIPGRAGNPGFFSYPVMANHIDLYEMNTGRTIDETGSGYNPSNPFVNRDPRLGFNVVKSGDVWRGFTMQLYPGGADYNVRTTTGVFIRKMQPPDGNAGGQKWHYIRLAEIYLNLAEALNEANNGPFAAAYDALNKTRTRPGVNMPLAAGLDYAGFKAKVQRERSVELAFESHRFFDLRRWKSPDIKKDIIGYQASLSGSTTSWSKTLILKNGFTDKMYFYPLPNAEVLKSPNLRQNPGY